MSRKRPLCETELNDVCIVVRLKQDSYGIPIYDTLQDFVNANESAIKQIARYVEGFDYAQVCSDINAALSPLEKWNRKEWIKTEDVV